MYDKQLTRSIQVYMCSECECMYVRMCLCMCMCMGVRALDAKRASMTLLRMCVCECVVPALLRPLEGI